LYRTRIGSMLRGVVGNDSEGRTVLLRLVTAFAPAALLGFFFGDAIKDVLFGPVPVTIAWAVGGVVLLLWKPPTGALHLHQLTTRSAVVIGIAQGVALWPGVSRSLVTLIAALAIGLTLSAALEFSFLLGLVTLSAASLYDFARNGSELVDQFGVAAPLVGLVTAFVTALLAVRWMVGYLSTHSLAIFGWYRLMIAGGCAVLLLTGVL
jgi:undecaprenyl-diphosphatase